jgi:SAM-dependent methyltransferase
MATASITTTTRPRRLNWGCGPKPAPGWLNSDRIARPGIDVPCDVRSGLPLGDASMDYVVAMHALQDLAYGDIVPALRELRRVLIPGGVLRVGVADLERAFDAYVADDPDYFVVPDRDATLIGTKLLRNALWCAWLRRPLGSAVRRSARLLAASPADRLTLRAALEAARGLPRLLGHRRPLPPEVLAALRLVESQAPAS